MSASAEVVRRTYQAFNARDFGAVRECFHDDVDLRPALLGGGTLEGAVFRGLSGIDAFLEIQAETWKSSVSEVVSLREAGCRALAETQVRAVGRASGMHLEAVTWNVFELRDGKVVRLHAFREEAEALESMGSSVKNVVLVSRWIRACNARDFDAALALARPDFEMTEAPALPGAHRLSGHEELRRYFEGWLRQWSDWSWQADEIVDAPRGQVFLDARLALLGLRSNAWVERRWAYVFTVRDGMLARQHGFDDRATALDAAGLRA
jgi:ketosteroid isomerase-like protein